MSGLVVPKKTIGDCMAVARGCRLCGGRVVVEVDGGVRCQNCEPVKVESDALRVQARETRNG